MAATTTKTKDARARSGKGGGDAADAKAKAKEKEARQKAKEKEARQKAEEREAKQKAKEKEAARKAKEKERAARAKDKEREAQRKEKEREARARDKQRAARQKEKEREQKAKERRDKEKAARAKEKEREQKAKDKQREARRKEKEREARFAEKHPGRHRRHDDQARLDDAGGSAAEPDAAGALAADVVIGEQEVQPVEDVAVPERGETTGVAEHAALAPLPELDVPDNDTTVHPKGYLAHALDKEDAVTRSTQRPTVAASYTTRDHDLIRAWAQTRGGRPADVVGTGRGGAGVLRIEFPDGPGDDSRLEDVDWAPFFATFDDSNVDFLYQERVRTGDVSRFHKIVRADD